MRLLILSFFLPCALFSQDAYYVSHIQGHVKKTSEKKELKIGDVVYLNDSFLFKKRTDYVSLISPLKGSRVARYEKERPLGIRNELAACLKDILLPSIKTVPLATRAGYINNLFEAETYFALFSKQEIPLLVIDSAKIPLGNSFKDQFPEKFFYIRYHVSNRVVNKKLAFHFPPASDSVYLLLNSAVFELDGKPVDQSAIDSVVIYYYDAIKEQSTETGTIRLIVAHSAVLSDELCIVKRNASQLYKDLPDKDHAVNAMLKEHVWANFGLPDTYALTHLLRTLNQKTCE